MAEQKKMGRPKLNEEDARWHRVSVRLTNEEYNRLKEYAESQNTTATQVILEGLNMVYSK